MKRPITAVLAVAIAVILFSDTLEGTAAARAGFSTASMKGSYAGIFSGQANTGESLISLLGTGIFIADGKGNLTGHETYTFGTTPCQAAILGTYQVDADGSGTDSVTFTTSSPGCVSGAYTQSLAIADKGDLVLLSNTNGDQINEEWHRQK
ncbi:MAG TPA: hypothetical protein VMU16_00500 [Candidatus Binataceae bacterium]|nr:hypothetical protein [Candidatus Binataceae bacterium]